MRASLLYASILIFCFIITTVKADIKWKYCDENANTKNCKGAINGNEKTKKARYSTVDDDSEKQIKQTIRSNQKKDEPLKKNKQKPSVNEQFSEEDATLKNNNNKARNNIKSEPKRFIGRIEHGKVMVLRRKQDEFQKDDDDSGEDDKQKVCHKSKGGKKIDCNESDDDVNESTDESSEKSKSTKKIKYSIKFQHEKQKKKKENNENISIMRLHKNGRNRYGKTYEDDSSEEDADPIKRFHFMDDDD